MVTGWVCRAHKTGIPGRDDNPAVRALSTEPGGYVTVNKKLCVTTTLFFPFPNLAVKVNE